MHCINKCYKYTRTRTYDWVRVGATQHARRLPPILAPLPLQPTHPFLHFSSSFSPFANLANASNNSMRATVYQINKHNSTLAHMCELNFVCSPLCAAGKLTASTFEQCAIVRWAYKLSLFVIFLFCPPFPFFFIRFLYVLFSPLLFVVVVFRFVSISSSYACACIACKKENNYKSQKVNSALTAQ